MFSCVKILFLVSLLFTFCSRIDLYSLLNFKILIILFLNDSHILNIAIVSIEQDGCQFWVKSMDCENELDPTEALHQKILLYCISVIAWAIAKILYIKGAFTKPGLWTGLDWILDSQLFFA